MKLKKQVLIKQAKELNIRQIVYKIYLQEYLKTLEAKN